MDPQPKLMEVARLAALLCDGQLTAAEMEQLDRLLLDDREAQAYYCRYMSLNVALEWTLLGAAQSSSTHVSTAKVPAPAASKINSLPSPLSRSKPRQHSLG